MKKVKLFFLFLFVGQVSFAGGGLLIPSVLNAFESDMQAQGLKLSASDIYNINHASLKDAIIHFNGGCTSSLVSNKGLLLTNYHCGRWAIISHSTLTNDITKTGFYAKNHAEELETSFKATRLVRIEDVTARVFKGTEGLSGEDAQKKINKNIEQIKAEAIKGTHYKAVIKPFNFGNDYYLLVKEVFLDVRLVGAPPQSIGKFGGDKDNWVWPRQTGDFSLFRIYVAPDGTPAEYSKNNIPYSPIHYLPISIKPKKNGEFLMVFGYPGRTSQHTISTKLDFIINRLRPAQIKMRGIALSVIDPAMKRADSTRLKYASKQSHIANAWKKWQGQIVGLKDYHAVKKKEKYEEKYIKKATTNKQWEKEYGSVIPMLKTLTVNAEDIVFAFQLYYGYTHNGSVLFERAKSMDKLLQLYKNESTDQLQKEIKKKIKNSNKIFNSYNKSIDKEIFKRQTSCYLSLIDSANAPSLFYEWTVPELTKEVYSRSFLFNKKRYLKILNHFDRYAKRNFKKDLGFQLYKEFSTIYKESILPKMRDYYQMKHLLLQRYVKGKYEMFPQQKHWPNANNTLRLAYGKLEGVKSKDGIKYLNHTTLKGVIEKYNTGLAVYKVPQRLLNLYRKKDFGNYAQNGKLWTCFLSSIHTAGGTSGSPVLNGKGFLVGLNFDRIGRGTMSDYMFDPALCRNISVDIRYVLWLIDKVGKAHHLVDEMTIVK